APAGADLAPSASVSARAGSPPDAPTSDPSAPDPAATHPESLSPTEIPQQPSVKEALKESAADTRVERPGRPRSRAWMWGLSAVLLGALFYLLDRRLLFPSHARPEWIAR